MRENESLENLIREHYPLIYRYVYRLTGHRELTEDVVQETMVKILTHYDRFRKSSRFSTWAITIATNTLRDWKRRKGNQTVALDYPVEGRDTPEEDLINKELEKRLMQRLLELPIKLRTVFVLRHFFEFSYQEAAEALQCPTGTIRSRLHKATILLKEAWNEENG